VNLHDLYPDIDTNPQLVARAREMAPAADPCHDFSHSLRVISLALQIAEVEGGNRDIIFLGALLHDIGRGAPDSDRPHAEVGAELAEEMLVEMGYPADVVEAVVAVVAGHSTNSKRPRDTIEAQIVHDADKIDAMGAIGLARNFSTAGLYGIALYRYAPDINLSMIDDRLRDNRGWISDMHTATGRRLGEERYRFELEFFKEWEKNLAGTCKQ